MAREEKVSYRNWLKNVKATKTAVFWIVILVIILTIIVGFNWGGWVTGGTADRSAVSSAQDAVTERLSLICVGQFNQDPQKAEKLIELKAVSSYQQATYVNEQGWATMPGEEKAERKVADACARLLAAQ